MIQRSDESTEPSQKKLESVPEEEEEEIVKHPILKKRRRKTNISVADIKRIAE
jgi:hypothetical protein